jgi:septal ring factor EnvC (AmiA/AmiB activator)
MTGLQGLKLRLWLEILGGALGGMLLWGYVSSKQDNVRMQSTITAQNQLIKSDDQRFQDSQKRIDSLQSAITQAKADTTKQVADLQKKFQASQTPQQIADLANQLMGLKDAIKIVTPAPTPQNPKPEPIAEVPLSNAPVAKAYLQACEECKTNLAGQGKILSAVVEQLKEKNTQLAAEKEKTASLTKERNAAVTSSKGGNWIRRTVHNSKVLAVGGAIAAAVICGSGHCK